MDFKICAIGCGCLANKSHGSSYKKYRKLNSCVKLAACCDLDEERAVKFKEEFGFDNHYLDIVSMLDAEKPDAVCLISPVHLTAKLSIAILERGYPLIMEKPPGLNRDETLAMINAAKLKHVPNQVAFNRRYMPVVREMKKRIYESFKPEQIQNIRYDLLRVNRRDCDFGTTAIHGIDAVKHIANSEYRHITFHYQELPHLGNGIANIFLECMFESGATAQLSFCPVSGITIERITANAYDNTFFAELPIGNSVDYPGRLLHFERNQKVFEVSGKELPTYNC